VRPGFPTDDRHRRRQSGCGCISNPAGRLARPAQTSFCLADGNGVRKGKSDTVSLTRRRDADQARPSHAA
jgi:hypothetical protein